MGGNGLILGLAIVFVVLPLAEIYCLLRVGQWLGVFSTICLLVFMAVAGAILWRHAGFATLGRVQAAVARGEVPALPLLEGVILLAAGVLLVTPGFLTDVVGIFLLLGPIRRWLARRCLAWFLARMVGGPEDGSADGPSGGQTVDAPYWRVEVDALRQDGAPGEPGGAPPGTDSGQRDPRPERGQK
jgi:UPF0716 protein FxsA